MREGVEKLLFFQLSFLTTTCWIMKSLCSRISSFFFLFFSAAKRGSEVVKTNKISLKTKKNFSFSRWLSQTSIQQLPNQTMLPLFRISRPKLNNSNVLFQFIALALFKLKRLQSLSLPCRCYKRHHHNFIVQHSLVPEAGLMLNIHHDHPAPFISSQITFAITLRLHHHLN